MASLLIEKLEILKSNEIKLKEEQRVLEEQIELEMEKKRRMKMDATLTKLEVQIDELAENFDENLVKEYNSEQEFRKMEKDFQKDLSEWHHAARRTGNQDGIDIMRKKQREIKIRSNVFRERKDKRMGVNMPEMKIYSDIVPLFRTMMGIMQKQQREIDELKSRF